MMMIHMDFETFSVPKLGDVGSWAYASHPQADIISNCWAYDQGPTVLWSPLIHPLGSPDLQDLFDYIEKGAVVAAWNAEFEYNIWNLIGVKKYGWPELKITQLFDVQALALSLALPADLDTCAEILQMSELKDKEGKRLMQKLSKPRKPSKNNPHIRWPFDLAQEDYLGYFEYNRQDVVVERDIFYKLKRYMFSIFEQQMWLLTVSMNKKGIPVDVDATDAILDVLNQYESRLTKKLQNITGGEIKTAGQRDVMLAFLQKHGLNLPDLRKDTVAAELNDIDPELPEIVYDILELRQLLARTSVKKFEKLKEMVSSDGRVRGSLRYHNCTTGRWGSSGMQIHNLPRGDIDNPSQVISDIQTRDLDYLSTKYPEIKSTCSSLVRPIIRAEAAYRLLIADYSAIEAITIAWTVGDDVALNIVRSGKDIYKWFATILYGVSYEKVTKNQRKHAKVCLLGLGYQMGTPTFLSASEGYGIYFSWEEGERSVKLYRRTFPKVVKTWYGLEKKALKTVRTGSPQVQGKLRFTLEGDFLRMRLPSGRKLSYPYPKAEMIETPWGDRKLGVTCWQREQKTKKWIRKSVSPGKFTENAIQAIARDLLAEAKLRLVKSGYNVLFSVHDEIICHNRLDFGTLDEMIEIMCKTNQKIYPGLPMSATGFVTERYRKG